MRLSEDASSSQAGPSGFSEMRQTNHRADTLLARPHVYYGEGPFDPPSSDDEDETGNGHSFEDDTELTLLGSAKTGPLSPGTAERGHGSPNRNPEAERHRSSIRRLSLFLIGLVSLAAVIGIISGLTYSGSTYHHTPGKRRITMDHVLNGTFYAAEPEVNWVAEAGDGVFSQFGDDSIQLVDLKSNKITNLVQHNNIIDENGRILYPSNWKLSYDMKFLLLKTSSQKQWRHSSFGNYYVHDIAQKNTYPIIPPSNPPKTAYATWSPTGHSIAYVTENDLYVLPSAEPNTRPIRVTTSGNASLFHGVPDWVYEEEVFGADFALWWSPDSSKVAFLALDETKVPEFSFPTYNPTDNSYEVIPYTTEVTMKYPKPGYPNPLVSVHIFDLAKYLDNDFNVGLPADEETLTLDWDGRHPVEVSVIIEVAWVGNSSLIVKEVNRNADDGNVVLFDLHEDSSLARARGKVVRKLGKKGEQGDHGWIDSSQTIYPIPVEIDSFTGTNAYLDIVPTPEGYDHIALFNPANSEEPLFLTSGAWEVTGKIKAINTKKGLVYFEAAKPSIERHVLSVPLLTSNSMKMVEPQALTEVSKPGYYSSKFSSEAGFYVLNYHGPGIPWTKVVDANNPGSERMLADNEQLRNTSMEYEAATVVHSTLDSEGYELNVKEIRPPRMDDSGRTKYPVLFRVYGGPNSQMVDLKYGWDWSDYIACGLQYIVVTVDGRGTGFKGRKLRSVVKDNLGFYETIDQINAAKVWARKPYVDPKRIGIWGWSYGGFMSSKVVEANAKIHSLAMAVAPVTSWRLYDSIYTERYMNLPKLNPGGYINASISNVEGFKEVDFLLAHGSGDDNVHFANTAHLLDMFTSAQVRNFRFRMFTDSDHSIYRRHATRELYEYMTGFLVEKWGKGGKRRI